MKTVRVPLVLAASLLLVSCVLAAGAARADQAPDGGQPGPFAVGHLSLMLSDPSRTSDLGSRPVPVEVFYPADQSAISESVGFHDLWTP
jgi:hypothetical protein